MRTGLRQEKASGRSNRRGSKGVANASQSSRTDQINNARFEEINKDLSLTPGEKKRAREKLKKEIREQKATAAAAAAAAAGGTDGATAGSKEMGEKGVTHGGGGDTGGKAGHPEGGGAAPEDQGEASHHPPAEGVEGGETAAAGGSKEGAGSGEGGGSGGGGGDEGKRGLEGALVVVFWGVERKLAFIGDRRRLDHEGDSQQSSKSQTTFGAVIRMHLIGKRRIFNLFRSVAVPPNHAIEDAGE